MDYHEIIMQLAGNSPFLGFVMYNWWQMSKRNEEYRIEMKTDRELYEKKREDVIDTIRNRYAQVIKDLKQEIEECRKETERIREKCEQEKNTLIQNMDRKLDILSEKIVFIQKTEIKNK